MIVITLSESSEISATTYSDASLIPNNLENSWIVDEKDLPKAPIQAWDIIDGAVVVNKNKLELYKRLQYPKLTRYQFMRGMLEYGYKSSDIEAQIMLIEDEYTRELTMIGFKDAGNFVRTDESILSMQSVLNLTDERVDQMWEYASTLQLSFKEIEITLCIVKYLFSLIISKKYKNYLVAHHKVAKNERTERYSLGFDYLFLYLN